MIGGGGTVAAAAAVSAGREEKQQQQQQPNPASVTPVATGVGLYKRPKGGGGCGVQEEAANDLLYGASDKGGVPVQNSVGYLPAPQHQHPQHQYYAQ